MVANRNLKNYLLKKLGLKQSNLYKEVSKIREVLGMGVDESICLFALLKGVKLERFEDPDKVERIRDLHYKYNTSLGTAPSQTRRLIAPTKKASAQAKVIKMPSGETFDDPLLPDRIKKEARDMAAIYPLFYYLENSIRSFLCAAMKKYHGTNWWSTKVKQGLKDKVAGYKNKESKNEWHQRRGDREIDYLDLSELIMIYSKVKVKLVKDGILPNERWLEHLFEEVYPSRCVVAHMNPLDSDNIQAVKVKVKQWNKQVKACHKRLQ